MKKKKCTSGSESALAIGLAIGVVFGLALDNLAVGIGIGTVLGLTMIPKLQGKG